MSEFKNLKIEISDGIAVLTISRTRALNALNLETLDEINLCLDQLLTDGEIRALIITGEGDRAFVAGADIKEMAEMDPIAAKDFASKGQSVFARLENSSKPVIAAVNGFSLGGGCELAMACHIRIASENARFGQPEVKLGLIPGFGGTQRLTRLVGKGMALELLISGEMIQSQRALEIGLVNRVVKLEELLPVCKELAAKISENGPQAISYCLEAVRSGSEMTLTEALKQEAALFGLCFATQDMREGTRAFMEKRKAEFKGK